MCLSRLLGQHLAALRALLVLTVLLGLGYRLAVTAVAQLVLPGRAEGSLVRSGGAVVGSSLIGQAFADEAGNPLPQWFHGLTMTVSLPAAPAEVPVEVDA